MSYGLPIVTTSIGAEGMNLVHKENAMICDTAEHFAESVVELYTSYDLWQKLSLCSVDHINSTLSPIHAGKNMDGLFLRLFGSSDINDYVRLDIRRLLLQWDDKDNVTKLKKTAILNMLNQEKGRSVIIWGAGNVGLQTLIMLHEIGVDVEGFIDSDLSRKNTFIGSIPIFSPDVLKNNTRIKPFVVIGTSSIYHSEIEKQLINSGFHKGQDFCTLKNYLSRR